MSIRLGKYSEECLYDIFLSYPSNERSWIEVLCNELERQSIKCFLDEKDIQPGKNSILALSEALERSRFLVLLLSKESVSRPWVTQEWSAFVAFHGPTDRILPVMLEPVEIPAILSPIQVIQATDRNAARVACSISLRVEKVSTDVSDVTLLSGLHGDLPDQLARSQTDRFRWIRRYPFQDIDRILIGDALGLYADKASGAQAEHNQRVSIANLVDLHRTIVLIGEPGSGKSTALQQITHDHAEAYLEGSYHFPPLYVDLKWWTTGLHDLLESTICDLWPNLTASTLSQYVSTAPISYYLDSFDEAQNPELILREIKALANKNQSARFLVASRPCEVIWSLDFATYELAPLNRAQIREILELYLSKHFNPEEIKQIYKDIEHYGLFAELGNPMMLWFFSIAVRDAGSVERLEFLEKGKIFSVVVEKYFLSTWEPKSLKSWTTMNRRNVSLKADLLSKLSLKMIKEDDKIIVTDQWVIDEFITNLVGHYSNPSELGHALLDQILSHHLLERNVEHLTFWHKSLRNFFAAKSLANAKDFPHLTPLIHEVRWHEPIIMLASLDPRFAEVIDEVACANPILALDCVAFSQLSRDPAIVNVVVHAALNAFLSNKPLLERIRIIQRFAALYKRAPELFRDATHSFLYIEQYVDLKPEYESRIKNATIISKAVALIKQFISEHGIDAKIEMRIRTLSSFIRKASSRNVKDIYDLFSIRVLVNDIRETYQFLGLVHSHWKPVPGLFKDYIAMPKSNMYQALHTTVMMQFDVSAEIIIQTTEMHEFSQRAWFASYKSEHCDELIELENRQFNAGVQVIPIQSQVQGGHKMAVLTPKDGLVLLDEDATVLDCAYRIHSKIFQQCLGALVNGKRVHIGHPLKNLDRVTILVDANIQPEMQWLSCIRTTSAQRALGRILRKKERSEFFASGKLLLDAYINGVASKTGVAAETVSKMIMRHLGCQKFDELCCGIARGKYNLESLGM